jgi:phosphoglycerate dehydrogenase-like enzyme
MRLIAWTRHATPDRAVHGLAFVSLEKLFEEADVVSLHLSYRPETDGFISRALLARMKPTARFVNTARAKLVDNVALAEILAAGGIAGAAIDVHEEEPPRGEYVFRALPNVLITPHIGYNTREASATCCALPWRPWSHTREETLARGQRCMRAPLAVARDPRSVGSRR